MQNIQQSLHVILAAKNSNYRSQGALSSNAGSLESFSGSRYPSVGKAELANSWRGLQLVNCSENPQSQVKIPYLGGDLCSCNYFQTGVWKNAARIVRRKYKKIVQASYDDEFRSSRSIALGLHRRYKDVVNGGNTNLQEFIRACVTAYAVGCTDEGLRKELLSVSDEHCDINMGSSNTIGLKPKLTVDEVLHGA